MASAALDVWNGESAARIADLLHAHQTVGGSGPGRRWRTEQLNWALVLLIAAEFQRYCRSLHDLSVDELVAHATGLNVVLASSLRAGLTSGRKLDSGNAQSGSLGSDLARLGIQLWPALKKKSPGRASSLQTHLDALNLARNGIAHADVVKLGQVTAAGYALSQLATVRKFHGAMHSLAKLLDVTLAEYLARVSGGPAPW